MRELTKGGGFGHWIRRLIHVFMLIIPFIYYYLGTTIASTLQLSPHVLVIIIVVLIFLLEVIRLFSNWTVFGQRAYEAKQISSFTWGALAIGLVLLFAPGKEYGIPIIVSWALGDPLLGELRRLKFPIRWVVIMGSVFIAGLWWISAWWFATPWWMALLMSPVTVAAEWPNLSWIDDNAMMQLIPLLVIFLLHGLICLTLY